MGQHRVIGGSKIALDFQQTSFTSLGPHIYTGISLGTATADRVIIVGVGYRQAVPDDLSMTINGSPLTRLAGGDNGSEIWAREVPAGTSATIDIDPNTGYGEVEIGVWAAYGVKSITSVATRANLSGPIAAKPRGAVIAVSRSVVPFDESPGAFSASGLSINAQPAYSENNGGIRNGRTLFASALTTATSHAYSISPPSNSLGESIMVLSLR